MSDFEVEFVKWGWADRYPGKNKDTLCINRNFKKYPDMLKKIIKHELSHDHGKNTTKDFMIDLTIGSQISFYDQLLFMIKCPTTMAALLPVRYSKKRGLIVDLNGIYWWVGILAVGMLAWILA